MKFGEVLKHQRPDLVISARHDAWLQKNDSPVYSQEALAFAARELAKLATPVDRRGKISASSLGSCARQQMFTFIGMPELSKTPQNSQQCQNGNFLHLRWQMAGLTEGWLVAAEVPIPANSLHLRGTQDGITDQDTLAEFKSISPHGYSSVANFGVKDDHRFQVGTYMAATGMSRASVIYENKGNQEYCEYMVEMDDDLHNEIEYRAQKMWRHADEQELPEPLDKCMAGEGWQYRFCPFRNVCMKVKSWEEAEEVARG